MTTPYQAIHRVGLGPGDLAVVVGVGGVGGYAVQIAHAFGAVVAAIDVDPVRLQMAQEHGARLGLRADQLEFKALKQAVRDLAKTHGVPSFRWRIFECSGTPAGQGTCLRCSNTAVTCRWSASPPRRSSCGCPT